MTRATTPENTADPAPEREPRLNGVFLCAYDTPTADPSPVEEAGRLLQLQASHPSAAVQPEAILDDNNLLPFAFLRTGDRVGRSIVKIERADRAAGTGFLVAPDILLTNHHVLPDAQTAAGARALANYEAEPPADPAGRPLCVPLSPGTLFVTNAELDFTFCGISGLNHIGCVPLERDSLLVMPSEYVNIIQHPRGRPKEVALQDSRVVKVDHVVVHYSCDTEPGSSGSPVFNNHWRLVALHHASVVTGSGQGGRTVAGSPPGARFLNEGIRLSAIAIWLESDEANAPESVEQVARLRRIFRGLDYQLGYFGALGRRAGSKPAAELVADSYRTRGRNLDLAFWNAAHLAPTALDRLPELGWLIAGMGIDVWCLSHLDHGFLNALAEHLESHFRLEYRVLPATGAGNPPLAALVRRGATRRVSWSDDDGQPPRLLIQPAGSARRLAIVPMGGEGGAPGLPRDPSHADLWLFAGPLDARDLHQLAAIAPDLQAAIGPDGGLAILPGAQNPLDALYVSPNLDQTLGGPGPLVVARDRDWSPLLDDLSGPKPIAARLLLRHGKPAKSRGVRESQDQRAPRRFRADAPGSPSPHLHPPLAPFRAPVNDEDGDDDPNDIAPHLAAMLDDPDLETMLRSLLDALRNRRQQGESGAEPG